MFDFRDFSGRKVPGFRNRAGGKVFDFRVLQAERRLISGIFKGRKVPDFRNRTSGKSVNWNLERKI